MATDIKDNGCPLLELPAKIRNKIRRYALPANMTITKSASLVNVPTLSQACRQILDETLPMFLAETQFYIHAHDWDGSFTVAFWKSMNVLTDIAYDFKPSAKSDIHQPRVAFTHPGSPNWGNLMIWAKAQHEYMGTIDHVGDVLPDAVNAPDSVCEVGFRVLNTVLVLRKLPWAEVELLLKEMHGVAKRADARWA